MTTTEITIKGRTYTFTAEGAEERGALSTIGSLFNSRGQFAGFVVSHNGRLNLIGGPKVSLAEERKGLAVLSNV